MTTTINSGIGAHSGADAVLDMFRNALEESSRSESNDLPDIPQDIIDWLAELSLLYGVPFEYLVPDAAMLPPESIRFFYLDENWIRRAIDGAVNVALGSSQDYMHVLTNFEELALQAALQRGNVRARLRGKALPATLEADGAITGVLLRSAVVNGWPGMEVSAWVDEGRTSKLPLLRLDRLSDNVLVALFNGVPQLVEFGEPPEGLHFGVIGTPGVQGAYQVALRSLGGAIPPGQQIKFATAPVAFRKGAQGVLDILGTRDAIVNKLVALGADPGGPFTSSQFAVEMVKGAGVQQFKVGTPKARDGKMVKA